MRAGSGPPGALWLGGDRWLFRVWAPAAERVEVRILGEQERLEPLTRGDHGDHEAVVAGLAPGTRYRIRLDGARELPDPASRAQPDGVHGASALVCPEFAWEDEGWKGIPLRDHVFYELHVGTFTEAGRFDAVVPHLDALRALGITTLELMPVAQFPGERNWGYDGAFPYAVQWSYGGPEGLRRLVNACHKRGLAVALDVVYNHLGPEGNYLAEFGPYFTDRYRTPWGPALNFDGSGSDEVRRFFVENALYWISELHVDVLRLDAVHAILDHSARPFLQQLSEAAEERASKLGRRVHLVAESSLNDTRVLRGRDQGGWGIDAQWSDDFHHALHTLLTGESDGYYQDFGGIGRLEKAFREGFVYSGERSSYRGRSHGESSAWVPGERLVVSAQNHDQVGNRMKGERLSALVGFEALKLAAGATLLSPFLPLLFMGEEHGDPAPFPYFVSHGDPALSEAVRRGRREEFAAFAWKGEPPDPCSEETFRSARVGHELRDRGRHLLLREYHAELLRLRRLPALARLRKHQMEVHGSEASRLLWLRRWDQGQEALVLLRFAGATSPPAPLELAPGRWEKRLDSAEPRWEGPGSGLPGGIDASRPVALDPAPESVALYLREG